MRGQPPFGKLRTGCRLCEARQMQRVGCTSKLILTDLKTVTIDRSAGLHNNPTVAGPDCRIRGVRAQRPSANGRRVRFPPAIHPATGCRCDRAHAPLRPLCVCVRPDSLPWWRCSRRHGSLYRRNHSILPRRGRRSSEGSPRRHAEEFCSIPEQAALAARPSRLEYRPPPRSESDGFLPAQGGVLTYHQQGGRLCARRLVTWDLGGNVPHIGIVVDQKARWRGRYMVVNNIGEGPKMEDGLFNWKITGHYRYHGRGA